MDALDVGVGELGATRPGVPRRTGAVRRRHNMVHSQQRVVRRQWFLLEHIESGTTYFAPLQRVDESRFVDQGSTTRVDENRSPLHQRQPFGVDDVPRSGGQRSVTGDDVGGAEQLLQ